MKQKEKTTKKSNLLALIKSFSQQPKFAKPKPRKVYPPQKIIPIQNTNQEEVYQRYLLEKRRMLVAREMQENQLSPYTQRQLAIISTIQNKSKTDDARRQRIRREQAILGKSMSILATPYIFKGNLVNPTEEVEGNPIKAPNVFKEREDNPHLLQQNRPNILQTGATGNNLQFF